MLTNFSRITRAFPNIDLRLLKLQFSFLLMVLGGRCNQLAVAWWALQETGSAHYFANMIACSITAEVLAKPLLGWLGDKYNKILIIKLASWISLLTALLMVVLSAMGSFNPWAVGALMMISSAIVGVRDPLQASVIPLFADDDKVSLAFRTKSVMSSFSILLGPVLASVLIYAGGITFAFAADFVAVLIAGALIATVPSHIGATDEGEKAPASGFNMIYSGFKVVYGVKAEFYLAIIAMLINFALFPFFTILIPLYVKDVIQYPVTYIGLLDSCFGLGILAGSYKIIGWLSGCVPRDLCVSAGFALLGCNLVVVGTVSSSFIVPVAFFCGGVGLMLINIPTSAVRLLATPKRHRNRIFATVSFLSAAASPVGSFAMDTLIAYLGITLTITLLGVMVLLLSALVFLVPDFKTFMRSPDTQLNDAYLAKYPEAFAH
ncbi:MULTISPECIES: MFS transporter [unclassified Pseudomonas]|uniref:MFS transporter n=1 Tax=unclassified Pseudomonas TaxID=196821 RepID=UPI002AC9BB3B|nr:MULTISPECIES: MFS transporter [unclassified Pseudomonas]MEB0043069.1 MFS transporter [Pseudomonas sp. MH10]MEB0121460.1 MFS transporter [Pseudomonas sp. CCI1.2]WPX64072.1 MFS transporter [Pseudomonas sp. MH10]